MMPDHVQAWIILIALCGVGYYFGFVLPRRRLRQMAERIATGDGQRHPIELHPESDHVVEIHGDMVLHRRPDGDEERFQWSELERIDIVASSDRPFAHDLFWRYTAKGGTGALIPQGALGEGPLREKASSLRGFDESAALSVGTDDARHVVWERK